jgi:hypothetical protein
MSKLILGILIGALWAPPYMQRGQDPNPESNARNVEIDGKLNISIEDYQGGKSRVRYSLETETELYPLEFAGDTPSLQRLRTGTLIRAKGKLSDHGALVMVGDDTGMETLNLGGADAGTAAAPAPVANTFGAQRTLWILVNFQDNPALKPWTTEQVRSMADRVSNFFLENSYKQAWLSSDIFGWFTVPYNSTTCEQLGIATQAKAAAAAAGADLSAYQRYVYVFPTSSCGFAGTATVGGNPSQSWINGDLSLEVVAHELGHNLGLYHSHSLLCDGTTLGANCTTMEYGDSIDMMGGSRYAHFNAFQKERLGWLDYGASPPLTTIQASGTYTLDPFESPGANAKALKILKGPDPVTGKNVWYYIEYRQAIGFDSPLATSLLVNGANILDGVVIRTGSHEESGNTSFLLDMTPETYHPYSQDPALVFGKTFSDSNAGVTITLQWANSTNAGVNVSLSQSPDSNPPTTSIMTPADGAVVTGVVTVQATAADDTGVKQVDLLVDGVVKGSKTSAPYSFLWDTSSAGKGNHTLQSVARDVAGNVGNSPVVTNTVPDAADTVAPTVTITSPANGATVPRNAPMTMTAAATDDGGVTKVEFYVGNKLVATDTSAPYAATWKVSGKANATYVLKAIAFDPAGNAASAAVSVTAK